MNKNTLTEGAKRSQVKDYGQTKSRTAKNMKPIAPPPAPKKKSN